MENLPRIFAHMQHLVAYEKLVADALESKTSMILTDSQLIDADVTLTEARQLLRYLQNFALPVMRLPPEVLCIIFQFVRAEQYRGAFDVFLLQPLQRTDVWIRSVMHVCRHWRAIAQTNPALWSTFSLRRHYGGMKCKILSYLNASQGLPLSVDLSSDADTKINRAVLGQLPRMIALRLAGSLTEEEEEIVLTTPAPLLRSFATYTSTEATNNFDFDELDGTVYTLPVLFNGVHPHLESLSFRVYRRYGANDFGNLTHLHMSDQLYATSDDFDAFLVFMGSLPGLQSLMLSLVRPSRSSEIQHLNPANHRVALPRLRRLVFAEVTLSFAGLVWRSLEIPQGTKQGLVFEPIGWDPDEEDPTEAEAEQGALSGLHLLNPLWNEVVAGTEAVKVQVCRCVWDVTIVGRAHDLCLSAFLERDFERACCALREVVARASAVWVDFTESTFERNPGRVLDFNSPAWILQNAVLAKKIFLTVDIRWHGPFPILKALCDDPVGPLSRWEECHVFMHDARPETLEHAEVCFRSIFGSGNTSPVFHLYPATGYTPPNTVQRWKDSLVGAGFTKMQDVQVHEEVAFPRIPVEDALAEVYPQDFSARDLRIY